MPYGSEVAPGAEVPWQGSGRIGAHRRHPFVPESVDGLLRCGELARAPVIDKRVRHPSGPIRVRLLGPAGARDLRRGSSPTRPGAGLGHEIPIRTRIEWQAARPSRGGAWPVA